MTVHPTSALGTARTSGETAVYDHRRAALGYLLDFIDGKYRLSSSLSASWSSKSYKDLTATERQLILHHSFSTEVFHGISELEVLEIFARLNTYSVPLNHQDLRNGKYFGPFKQSMYRLGYEHLEFWRVPGLDIRRLFDYAGSDRPA